MIGWSHRPMSPENTSRCGVLPPMLHLHTGAAEDVPGVVEGGLDVVGDPERLLVGMAVHQFLRAHCVLPRVQWCRLRARSALLLQPPEVTLLDMRRIGEHHGAEIARGRSRMNRLFELSRDEQRDPAGVIDVRMAQHQRRQLAGIKRDRLVEAPRFVAPSLEEAGIKGNLGAAHIEQVARTGHLSGRTPERQVDSTHWANPSMRSAGSLTASASR